MPWPASGRADIDVFELHDAFSIMSALSLEACGFAEPGQGPRLGDDGSILPGGRIPVATFGGLEGARASGWRHGCLPVGRGDASVVGRGGRVPDRRRPVGMAQNIGGSGATIVTHILRQG